MDENYGSVCFVVSARFADLKRMSSCPVPFHLQKECGFVPRISRNLVDEAQSGETARITVWMRRCHNDNIEVPSTLKYLTFFFFLDRHTHTYRGAGESSFTIQSLSESWAIGIRSKTEISRLLHNILWYFIKSDNIIIYFHFTSDDGLRGEIMLFLLLSRFPSAFKKSHDRIFISIRKLAGTVGLGYT